MMTSYVIGMLFLYFPEDKSEYIPAFISFSIFIVICIFTFRFFIKYSKKEEAKAKKLEEKLKSDNDERSDLK